MSDSQQVTCTVRPQPKGPAIVEQLEGFYATEEGAYIPIDEADRQAEMTRVDVPEDTPRPVEEEEEAGNEDEDTMEAEIIQARRAPKEPSEEERRRHEATHLPYRSWCVHCVRGRGQKKPHFRSKGNEEGVPKISMDYFFLGGDNAAASENPMIVLVDERNGNRFARMVEHKGMEDGEMDG